MRYDFNVPLGLFNESDRVVRRGMYLKPRAAWSSDFYLVLCWHVFSMKTERNEMGIAVDKR